MNPVRPGPVHEQGMIGSETAGCLLDRSGLSGGARPRMIPYVFPMFPVDRAQRLPVAPRFATADAPAHARPWFVNGFLERFA